MNRRPLLLCIASAALALACWATFHLVSSRAPLPERLGEADSVVVTYQDGTIAHVFLSSDDKWRVTRPAPEVDPRYLEALIALEDQRFWTHCGVDIRAIARAFASNLRSRRRVSGASTITMQLVRLLEPRPRTWSSKLSEAFRAMQLERKLTKEEILEAYLRFLPFGRNIEGIEAASLSYFGHGADALSPQEIAILLAVPQAPSARHPRAENQERLGRARDGIIERLIEAGIMKAEDVGELPLQVSGLRPFPRAVPHAAYRLRADASRSQKNIASSTGRIETTLDRGIQGLAEVALAQGGERARRVGIDNVAIVVVEHETGAVRALVGNFAFGRGPAGYLASFDAPRSPGSLLKPFIYAGAIDRGLALPGQLVLDVPFARGDYVAENYSGKFSGLVRFEDALGQSLNIPFIEALEELGVETHIEDLGQMGARHLRDDIGYYGLSAAVGALAVTPMEAAGFYATLARGGQYRPLELLRQEKEQSPPWKVYSPGASWLTWRALSRLDRPDFPDHRRARHGAQAIPWKTGTSTGNRDAWAAGFAGKYTVVVWMGNLNQRPHPALIGSEVAAPLLFDILTSLDRGSSGSKAEHPPADLVEVETCAHSGHLPTQACPSRVMALAPREAVATTHCPYHVTFDVDTETGELLTPECRAGRPYAPSAFLLWPPKAASWLSSEQRAAGQLPPYRAGCAPLPSPHPPWIASPPAGKALLLRDHIPASQQRVALRATASLVDYPLSWFVNGEHLGTLEREGALFWEPRVGEHRLTLVDRTGRAHHRTLRVVSP